MIFRRKLSRGFHAHSPTPAPHLRRRLFRRRSPGRTLIPSTENEFTNPHAKRTHAPRGWRSKLKRLFLLIILLLIAGFVVNELFLSSRLTITSIRVVEDQQDLPDHPLHERLKKLQGRNLLLVQTERIEEYVRAQSPEYATIRVHKEFPGTITLELEHFPLVAELVIEYPDKTEKKFFLNSAGQAVGEQTSIKTAPSAYKTILIQNEKPVMEGDIVITGDHLAFILEAIQNYEDRFGMKVTHALYQRTEREVHLWTERNFYVWLDLTQDLDSQLNKLKKALPRLNIYEESLSYIDLRIVGINGEKVIYKKK